MSHADYALLALCLWREARGEGHAGMTAVGCIVRNRVQKRNSSYYAEVTRPLQFSSMTAPHDPQLGFYPTPGDVAWTQAQLIAGNLIDGDVADITNGSTLYYDESISFPAKWDKSKVIPQGKIGRFFLFRETA